MKSLRTLPLNAFRKSRQGGPRYKQRLPSSPCVVELPGQRASKTTVPEGVMYCECGSGVGRQLFVQPIATHSANCMRQHTVLTPGELLTCFPGVKHSEEQCIQHGEQFPRCEHRRLKNVGAEAPSHGPNASKTLVAQNSMQILDARASEFKLTHLSGIWCVKHWLVRKVGYLKGYIQYIPYTPGPVHLGNGMRASRNHAYHTFRC